MEGERRQCRWQFSLRDICLVMAIVALAVAWWVDHTRLVDQLAAAREAKSGPWVIEMRGFVYHSQANPETWIEPVEGQVQVEAIDTFYVDDLPAFFEQLKKC